jgi:hypothetical protein
VELLKEVAMTLRFAGTLGYELLRDFVSSLIFLLSHHYQMSFEFDANILL